MVTDKMKRKLNRILLVFGIFITASFVSCTNQTKDKSDKESVNTEVIDEIEKSRNQLEKDLDKALKKADADLEILEARLADASEDAKKQIETAIGELKEERQKISEKLDDVAEASADTWKDVKGEVEESLKNANLKIDSLVNSV
jgi:uncharacterized protein YPO0396